MILTTKVIGIEGEKGKKIEDFRETEDLLWIAKLF
jgi:hypothetical protein